MTYAFINEASQSLKNIKIEVNIFELQLHKMGKSRNLKLYSVFPPKFEQQKHKLERAYSPSLLSLNVHFD